MIKIDHFNSLTPAELERLMLLNEAAAKIVTAISKIARHGYDSFNPDLVVNQSEDGPKVTNVTELERAMGELDAAARLMLEAKDVTAESIMKYVKHRLLHGSRYFHHQPDEYCAAMAQHILNAHPNAQTTAAELGRVIAHVTDARYAEFIEGSFSCIDLAQQIKFAFGDRWPDDMTNIAYTIQDWVDKVKTGDNVSE